MKHGRLILVCVIGLMAYASCLFANQITFTTQNYSVVAYAGEEYYATHDPTIIEDWNLEYNMSSYDGTPVSDSRVSPHGGAQWEYSIKNMSLYSSGATDMIMAYGGYDLFGYVDINVTGDWVFKANEELKLSFDGDLYHERWMAANNSYSILLRDLTESTNLINFSVTGLQPIDIITLSDLLYANGIDSEFFLIASHGYELKLSSFHSCFKSERFDSTLNAQVGSVPEPSTMLLLGCGLLGLLRLRKKFKK